MIHLTRTTIALFFISILPLQLSAAEASLTPGERVIAVASVQPVEKFSIENAPNGLDIIFPGPAFFVKKGVEKNRINELKAALEKQAFNVQEELASATLSALKEANQSAIPGDGIKYEKDDPTSIDYKNSAITADSILTVTISNMGLYSSRLKTTFAPRLNISFELVDIKTEDSIYSQSISYGADANKNSDDEITANANYTFASFEDALSRAGELVEAYRDGIKRTAQLAAQQIKRAH